MQSKIFTVLALLGATAMAAPAPHGKPAPAPKAPKTCQNVGYNFEVVEKCSPPGSKVPTDWDMRNLDAPKADHSGVRRVAGIHGSVPLGPNQADVYGKTMDTAHVGIKHHGFWFAGTTGEYTITLKGTDDAAYCFMGSDCATQQSTKVAEQLLNGAEVKRKIKVDAGHWVPFDCRWANVMEGPYNFDITIQDPAGRVILSKDAPPAETADMVVTRICPHDTHRVWTTSGLTQ